MVLGRARGRVAGRRSGAHQGRGRADNWAASDLTPSPGSGGRLLATGAGEYQLKLRKGEASAEFQVFRRGGHGVDATGRNTPDFGRLGIAQWPGLLKIWLDDLGLGK